MDLPKRIDCTLKEYHSSNRMSNTKIKAFIASPTLYHERYMLDLWRQKATPAMQRGNLVEDALATEDAIDGYFVNDARKGSKAWRENCAEHDGLIAINSADMIAIETLHERIRRSDTLRDIFWGRAAETQVTLHSDLYGCPWQVRYDWTHAQQQAVYDLKFTAQIVPGHRLGAHMYELGWHRQAWQYREIWRRYCGKNDAPFFWILAQNEPPHLIDVRPPDEDFLELGHRETKEAIIELEACQRTDNWDPAWLGRMIPVEQPSWTKEAPTYVSGDLIA